MNTTYNHQYKYIFYSATLLMLVIIMLFLTGCQTNGAKEVAVTSEPAKEIVVKEKPATTEKPTPMPTKEPTKYTAYNVALDLNPTTRKLSGIEKVTYTNQTGETLEQVFFQVPLYAFTKNAPYKPYFDSFDNAVFKNKDYAEMTIQDVSINGEGADYRISDTILEISLPTPLVVGGVVELSLIFDAYIPKIAHRTGANDHALWLGNSLPILSVHDENGWNNYPYYSAGDPFFSDIANYTVKITTPTGYTVAGTGEEVSSVSGDTLTTKITGKMVRDFALAVSKEYHVKTIKTNTGVYVNMYYYTPDLEVDKFLDIAKKSLDYFSNTVGSYPYSSFDIVETDLFLTGGMEYPSLTFIDSNYLLENDSLHLFAHEIGHQWFYNIIGNNQIKEPWLDEGITKFLELGIFYTPDEIDDIVRTDYRRLSDKLPNLTYKTLADDLEVYESWSDYYDIHYIRGELLFYDLSKRMGSEKWNEFLKQYFINYSYKIASGSDLITLAESVYGQPLDSFFQSWIHDEELPQLFSTTHDEPVRPGNK